MKISSFLFAAGAAVFASAQTNYTRCLNEYVAPAAAEELDAVVREANENGRFAAAAAAATIRVYAHVVTTTAKRGRYTQAQINEQIGVRKTAFFDAQEAHKSW